MPRFTELTYAARMAPIAWALRCLRKSRRLIVRLATKTESRATAKAQRPGETVAPTCERAIVRNSRDGMVEANREASEDRAGVVA
jgi:hypothetical protein